MACPGTTTVEGREFENEDQFDLGTVPFTEAFAQSCNTTFIQQALELPDPALAEAAASYGVGTEWQLPVGIFGGSVPSDGTGTTKAADAIGQGQVLMSPAQMALVAAGIASGTPAAPVEVVGAEPAGAAPAGPGQPVLDALRPMMRQVVLSGTATALGDRGEVYGKTGTAEYGEHDAAATPTAGSWATARRRRRATSPSPSSSRAGSPAASPSASPTPSWAAWADGSGRRRGSGRAGEARERRWSPASGRPRPPAHRAHLGGAQRADGELAGRRSAAWSSTRTHAAATPSSSTTASAAASTSDSTGNGSA